MLTICVCSAADDWIVHFERVGVWCHKVMSVDEVTHAPQPNAVGAFTAIDGYPL